MIYSLITVLAVAAGPEEGDNVGTLVRALWLMQRHGTADAVAPDHDQRLKGSLFKALGQDGQLTAREVEAFMDAATFGKLAGGDSLLSPAEITQAVAAAVPATRQQLLPKVRAHADRLTTSFDMIGPTHRLAGQPLVDWLAAHYQPGRPIDVIVVCTGNSRRSILGSTMGNIAAAYYGMPEVRFHSGGTDPTAFNPRTIQALREIGVEVAPTGAEAIRGEPQTANPVYRVRWGAADETGAPGMEATEFSKRYDDPINPSQGFAALMVCSEADVGCPFVRGAALRVSMPYLDPKIYDGSSLEAEKYAERRDDMGRLMLSTMMQARQRLATVATSAARTR